MEKEKIQNLISQMTLEEKAGMCSGADFWHLKGIERLGIPSVMVTNGRHGLRKQAQGADHLPELTRVRRQSASRQDVRLHQVLTVICPQAGTAWTGVSGNGCKHDPRTGNEH